MISFEDFKATDGRPIYLQILEYIKRGAASGRIADGDELPSRRVLSALLGINPNTVQKAFRMLEEQGLIESRSGAKSFMTLGPEQADKLRAELLEEDMRALVSTLKQAGLTGDQAADLLRRYWDEEETNA